MLSGPAVGMSAGPTKPHPAIATTAAPASSPFEPSTPSAVTTGTMPAAPAPHRVPARGSSEEEEGGMLPPGSGGETMEGGRAGGEGGYVDARDESEAFERKQQVAGRTDAAWQGQTAEDSSGGASMFARAADAASSAAASIAGMAGSMLGQGAEVAATGFETAKAAVISTVQGGEGAAAAEERELQEGEEAPMSSQLAAGGGGEGLATSTTTTTTTAVPALQQPLSAQRPVVHHMPAVPANTAADRAAAVTTAAVLPSSAVSPAATGRGYFPTVGAVAETPRDRKSVV